MGRRNLELIAIAVALGGNVRAGLEGTLSLREGELADGTAPLVPRAIRLVEALDRVPATVDEARATLALGSLVGERATRSPRGVGTSSLLISAVMDATSGEARFSLRGRCDTSDDRRVGVERAPFAAQPRCLMTVPR